MMLLALNNWAQFFMAVEIEPFFDRKHNVVTNGVMMLRASNQVLCNMWSLDFYDMTISWITK